MKKFIITLSIFVLTTLTCDYVFSKADLKKQALEPQQKIAPKITPDEPPRETPKIKQDQDPKTYSKQPEKTVAKTIEQSKYQAPINPEQKSKVPGFIKSFLSWMKSSNPNQVQKDSPFLVKHTELTELTKKNDDLATLIDRNVKDSANLQSRIASSDQALKETNRNIQKLEESHKKLLQEGKTDEAFKIQAEIENLKNVAKEKSQINISATNELNEIKNTIPMQKAELSKMKADTFEAAKKTFDESLKPDNKKQLPNTKQEQLRENFSRAAVGRYQDLVTQREKSLSDETESANKQIEDLTKYASSEPVKNYLQKQVVSDRKRLMLLEKENTKINNRLIAYQNSAAYKKQTAAHQSNISQLKAEKIEINKKYESEESNPKQKDAFLEESKALSQQIKDEQAKLDSLLDKMKPDKEALAKNKLASDAVKNRINTIQAIINPKE